MARCERVTDISDTQFWLRWWWQPNTVAPINTSFQCCAVRRSHKAKRPRAFVCPASARTTLSNKLEPSLPETRTTFSQQTLLFVYCFSLTNFAETRRRRSFYRSLIEYDFAIRGNLSRRCMHCHDVTLFIVECIHGECIRQTFIGIYRVWHVGDGVGCVRCGRSSIYNRRAHNVGQTMCASIQIIFASLECRRQRAHT